MSDVSVWNKQNLEENGKKRFFPTEMMLRSLFSSNYFQLTNKQEHGCVLDIGCLYGNNLLPFEDRGWELYGTEVTEESVQITKNSCKNLGISVNVQLGFNRKLPFEDGFFDILLSLATIHYEESLQHVEETLIEFKRVMKKDGVALIQTVAPRHSIFVNSKEVGGNVYELDMEEDIRHQQRFVFFKKNEEFLEIAKRYFSKIETARCTEEYPKSCIDLWLFKLSNS